MNTLVQTGDCGKGHSPDQIIDDGDDMNHLIHEGKKAEDLLLKDVTIPDTRSTDNVDFNIFQTIIKRQLEVGQTDKWNKIINTCMGIYEETSTGVHHLYTMQKTSTDHQN